MSSVDCENVKKESVDNAANGNNTGKLERYVVLTYLANFKPL